LQVEVSEASMRNRRVIFIFFDEVEVLDVTGPLQAFHDANALGASYVLQNCSHASTVRLAQGLTISDLKPLPSVNEDDLIIVPGYPVLTSNAPRPVVTWLKAAYAKKARISSVCTGAFVLAEAGILNGRYCTTHWKRVAELQRRYPQARVLADRLYVEDRRVVTSAGIASGIDMSLALIEKDHGPRLTSKVARTMVIYLRRDSTHSQQSAYLDYRTHLHPGIHVLQDWLTSHLSEKTDLPQLASIAGMSTRNLTRVFREATGISIQEYRQKLRLEYARTLLHDPSLTLEAVASQSGLGGERQLRRAWRSAFGHPPADERRASIN
jgi:transcriptional regulator GlxA family with amidase domain